MRRRLIAPRQERGLTLLELVVAILVLSVATLGTYRVMGDAGDQIGQERERMLAQIVAANQIRLLRLAIVTDAPEPAPRAQIGPYGFALETTTERTAGGLLQVTVTARADSGPGAHLVSYLPASGR
ncbi:prepilin-type N-terminal cleavage/methylation domain-containing protein [Ruegeria marina]|uniref:Prepilin-type N-terminal cleavage/methylation domain-containing protein n=2 Tax=Ruegeria marina TaxID=639004 RepID=A0A1G7CE48_9RHOB|nr:prepilin-type N-terminal cleavage/methylation domain-containing protein [Ruegeria marina]SDE37523.1 prepilin-type N-terminal cleavage/methylation domain-containing protein [Ruegeria marina]